MLTRKQKGQHAEQLVAKELESNGFTILALNYRKFFGEIDIIAQQKDLIVFVEVKTRTHNYVDPTELIIQSKQKKISLVAQEFIASQLNNLEATYRFDVALVEHNNTFTIRYIENAFTCIE